jgi:hypothetical protein
LVRVTVAATPFSKLVRKGLHFVRRWNTRSRTLKTVAREMSHKFCSSLEFAFALI